MSAQHNHSHLLQQLPHTTAQHVGADGASLTMKFGDIWIPVGVTEQHARYAEAVCFTLGRDLRNRIFHSNAPAFLNAAFLQQSWPMLAAGLVTKTPFRSLGVLPFAVGTRPAVLELYFYQPDGADNVESLAVTTLSLWLTELLTNRDLTPLYAELNGPHEIRRTRHNVSIATGITMAAENAPPSAALDMLTAQAFTHNLTLDELAERLIQQHKPESDYNTGTD